MSKGNMILFLHLKMGWQVVQNNRKYGCISTDGKLSVGLNYDDAKPFSEGYGAVCQSGKWGFIDTNGEMKIPLQYEAAMPFSEEMASVKLDGKWGVSIKPAIR